MKNLEEYIDWLTHGLCCVGCHADDALNRYLKKLCVTENPAGRMHRCILRLPGSFMEPITVHAPTETVPGTPYPSPPRYPH